MKLSPRQLAALHAATPEQTSRLEATEKIIKSQGDHT